MFRDIFKRKKEENIIKAILKLAWPIIIANVFQAAYQLTDSFWVGRLGEKAVASVTISSPIIFLLVSLGIGFGVSGAILTAQYFGAENQKMVDFSAAQTILMIVVVSIILSITGFLLAPNILNLMNAPTEIYDYALKFLRIAFLALLPNFSFFMFQSIMRSIGKPTIPVFIVIGTVLLNFILDPLLMFGWKFIPGMEVVGVALATIITQTIAATIGLIILFSGKRGIHLKLKNLKPDFKFIKKSFFLGLPASIEQSARSLGMTVMTSLIIGFGTLSVASYGAGSNIIQIIIILSIGLSAATSALTGQSIGAKNIKRAEKITITSTIISFILLTIFGIIVYFSAPKLIAFFVPNDLSIIENGAHFLRIVCLSFGFIGIQMSVAAILQSSGNTMTAMLLTLTSQWVIQITLAFVLSKFTSLGINGFWYSLPITNVIISLVYIIVFKAGRWKKKKITEDDRLSSEIMENIQSEEIISYDA
ncbi:MAG TPA: MATE family efflux transporter [bacterium]|nr:MATE family efflux transporter [bacterium]